MSAGGYTQLFHAPLESFYFPEALDMRFNYCVADRAVIQASETTAIFNQAQALRKVRLIDGDMLTYSVLSADVLLDRPIPWHHFTELNLRQCPLGSHIVYSLLFRCTNLQIYPAIVNMLFRAQCLFSVFDAYVCIGPDAPAIDLP